MTNTVVLKIDENNNFDILVNGENVRVVIIDDRSPSDRYYEWTTRNSADEIVAALPIDAEIGSRDDKRHAAVENRVQAVIAGKRHLKPVE